MKKQLIFAWRNLWRNKKRTYITLGSIVFAVVIATFMRGMQLGSYEKMLNDAIRSSTGHYSIMGKDYWDDKSLINSMEYIDEIKAQTSQDANINFVAPAITSGCLVSSGLQTRGVLVKGVDPDIEIRQSGLNSRIISGDYFKKDDEAVIMGSDLAKFLKVRVGDTIVLLGQGYQGVTAAGKYHIKGIFEHPMPELNKRVVYLPIQTAEYLFFMEGRLSTLAFILNDFEDIDGGMESFSEMLDLSLFEIHDWRDMNRELVQSIESDNFFGKIMIGVLYMVIGFGIFGTILMMTLERRKEFSIMIAIGMRRVRLLNLVIIETIYLAALGSAIGLILSIPVVWFYHLNPIHITGDAAKMYYEFNMEPILPVSTRPGYMIGQFGIVLLISLFASLIPLNNILTFNFVNALRGRQ